MSVYDNAFEEDRRAGDAPLQSEPMSSSRNLNLDKVSPQILTLLTDQLCPFDHPRWTLMQSSKTFAFWQALNDPISRNTRHSLKHLH